MGEKISDRLRPMSEEVGGQVGVYEGWKEVYNEEADFIPRPVIQHLPSVHRPPPSRPSPVLLDGQKDNMSASPSHHLSATKSHTDFAPGFTDSRGHYRPTAQEVKAYQASRVTGKDHEMYGYWTLAALLGLLLLFTALNVFRRVWIRYASLRSSPARKNRSGQCRSAARTHSRLYTRLAALVRWLSYPRLSRPVPLLQKVWTLGPLGPNVLILFGLILTSCLEWINKYYFFPNWYGSAPLFLRAGWIALACLPFIFVLGSKRNLIAFLTGIPHHHLQVLHQGLALIFTYMAIVHAVAALIRGQRDYGFFREFRFNQHYPSGALSLAALLVLFVGSMPVFRKHAYELFWLLHISMAILFIGALCWHSYDLRHAYIYYNTTIALFCFSFIARFIMMLLNNPKPHLATARILDETTLSLSMPTRMSWEAGAHVFVRILEVRPLESHPFSILSPPPPSSGLGFWSRWRKGGTSELQLLIRKQDGFTCSLYDRVAARGGECRLRCVLDGPYGGHSGLEDSMNEVLCVAAGSGITGVLGLVQQFATSVDHTHQADGMNQAPREGCRIKLIWVVRGSEALGWVEKPLQALRASKAKVEVQIHVTSHSPRGSVACLFDRTVETSMSGAETPLSPSSSEGKIDVCLSATGDLEKGLLPSNNPSRTPPSSPPWSMVDERPDIGAEVLRWVGERKGSLGVIVCGPTAFSAEVANAVAGVQRRIYQGALPDISEVVLETESFGW